MLKVLRRAFAFLVAVAVLVALGMLLPRPLLAAEEEPPAHRILVLTNPIHTDIAIPVTPDIVERFAFLEAEGMPLSSPGARWLIVGWGGRAFYLETPTWSELKAMPVLKALTVDRSVMHIDVAGGVDETHPSVTAFDIGEAGFERLAAFIDGSFQRAAGEPIALPGTGYGPTDQFYEANGTFNALIGCNTWTARALREAGLRTGWWNPVPTSLARSLEMHN